MYIDLRKRIMLFKPTCVVKKLCEDTGSKEAPYSPQNGSFPGKLEHVLWPALSNAPTFESPYRKGNGTRMFRLDRT